jgi:hypothetical protein
VKLKQMRKEEILKMKMVIMMMMMMDFFLILMLLFNFLMLVSYGGGLLRVYSYSNVIVNRCRFLEVVGVREPL